MKSPISFEALEAAFAQDRIDAMRKVNDVGDITKPWSVAGWTLFVGMFAAGVVTISLEGEGINRAAVFFSITIVVLMIAAITYVNQVQRLRQLAVRRLRFDKLADDNGLQFVPLVSDPAYPGVLFAEGSDHRLVDVLRSGGSFEIGNFIRLVRQGKNTVEKTNGYIRITLPRHVAHMILDGKANNLNIFGASLSNLDLAVDRDQVLSLEGDFNDHFTLYAPKEYERDAFYVFTPDLMAALIDHVAQYDVEVVDNQLFIYSSKFELLDRATLANIFTIIDTVGAKTISQTDYYADEKVGDRARDVVARQGRRLKWGLSWQVIAFLAFYALYAAVQIIADLQK